MLHYHRLRLRETPVRMYERGGGVSSIRSGKSLYYMIKVLLAIFIGLVRRRPVADPSTALDGGRIRWTRILRVVAVAASVALFILVLELVRRRRLLERYALLWLSRARSRSSR